MRKRINLKSWKHWHLTTKLILIYMPLIIVPVILAVYGVTYKYNQSSKEQAAQYSEAFMALLMEKIDRQFKHYEELSLQFYVDPEILRLLDTKPSNELEGYLIKQDLSDRVNNALVDSERTYIKSIEFRTKHGSYLIGNQWLGDSFLHEDEFFSDIVEQKGKVVWDMPRSHFPEASTKQYVRLGRMINHIEGSQFVQLSPMAITIDPEVIFRIFKEMKINDQPVFRLYHKEQLLLSNTESMLEDQSQYMTISTQSSSFDWTLDAYIPLKGHYESIREAKAFSVMVTIVCIALGLILTRILAVDMIIPIKKLMRNMNMGIQGVDLSKLIRFDEAREVTELNNKFISVMYEVNHLTQELILNQKKKQDAEISVLHSQLSPHFLHNTLNSIRWMAMIHKQNNIKEMVDSLNNLLSYSIRELGRPVRLEEELNILFDYVKIQKVRYRNFSLTLDVPDELKSAYVLKFLIQPLIENALIHGMAKGRRHGNILLEANREEDCLHIIVTDNGQGIVPEKLNQIRHTLSGQPSDNHLGLTNIHERIQLHYGKNFGLHISSKEGEGTRVALRLPYIEKEPERR